jgi:hypothetical protein
MAKKDAELKPSELEDMPTVATLPPAETGEVLSLVPAKEATAPPEQVQRELYWLGVKSDCPLQMINIGGITFHKETFGSRVSAAEPDKIENIPHAGCLVKLTKERVKEILLAVSYGIIVSTRDRWVSAKSEYIPADGDEIMGRYLYMVKLPGPQSFDRNPDRVPPLVAREA